MKNITDYILEALNTLPREFMNVWKGKPANIDPEYFDNIALLSQGIMDVHRRELPTEKEFDNLCNWMIENFKSKSDAELFMTKMVEIFVNTNTIVFDWYNLRFGKHAVTQFEPCFFFLYHEFKESNNKNKDKIDELPAVKYMFSKWNKTPETWPNYSKSFRKLADYVNNL